MLVSIINSIGADSKVTSGFNSSTVIIDTTGFAYKHIIVIQLTPNIQITHTGNNSMFFIIDSVNAKVKLMSGGNDRYICTAWQVVQCSSPYSNMITINTPCINIIDCLSSNNGIVTI